MASSPVASPPSPLGQLASLIWWTDLGEQVLKSFARGFLGVLGVDAVTHGVNHWQWMLAASVGAAAAAVSVLDSFAGLQIPNGVTSALPHRLMIPR